MQYYEVGIPKRAVREQDTLTYHHDDDIPLGSIVRTSLGSNKVNGVVFSKVSKPKYQTKPIEELLYPAALPEHLLDLAKWVADYYTTQLPHVLQHMLPAGLHKKRREGGKNTDMKSQRHATDHTLTKEQTSALKTLDKAKGTAILHGVTGSGKTRIYLERIAHEQQNGKGAIVLVPEIGLTSQLVSDVRNHFGEDKVFLVHSAQTESERHQTWEAIAAQDAPIVVGARSALFSPVHKLGLIVVDEEHENAYKQDQSPKYHAVRVASMLARLSGALTILGSATPSVEDYYLAKKHNATIVRLNKTAVETTAAEIEVIDMKKRHHFGSSWIISKKLYNEIEKNLLQKRQVLLFHNRRGTSTQVVCTNCGWVANCPNCHLPLTHHHDSAQLICHICNHRSKTLHSCPSCKQPSLLYKGVGTKQIETEVAKLFPGSKIARFDSDSKLGEQLKDKYDDLYHGKVDIIIGTQMVAKGLDLPQLGLVGVVVADTALYLPDFSANERAFQLLYQVIGRVGRHQQNSGVVIQSYTPDHVAIKTAIKRDYQSFFDNEISQRELLKYPPFSFLLQISLERANQASAMKAAQQLMDQLTRRYPGLIILGPTPAFHERSPRGYRWQIVVKAKQRKTLQRIIKEDLPDKCQFELDPINLL